MKKTIGIIGASGFLGKALVNYFGKISNYEVISLGRHENFIPYDYIINCAGIIHSNSFDDLYLSNSVAPIKYLNAYYNLNKKVKFLHLGSSSEYGPLNFPYKESDECKADTYYGITKFIGTTSVISYAKLVNGNINVVRPFSVYGHSDNKTKFIPSLIRNIKAGEEIKIYPGVHDWIWENDFCRMCHAILERNFCGEIFNCGSGISFSNLEVCNILQMLHGKKLDLKIISNKYRVYDRDFWVANIEKAKSLLGWVPETKLTEGLYELFDK